MNHQYVITVVESPPRVPANPLTEEQVQKALESLALVVTNFESWDPNVHGAGAFE